MGDRIIQVCVDGDHVFVEIGASDGSETYQFHLTPEDARDLADRLNASAREAMEG